MTSTCSIKTKSHIYYIISHYQSELTDPTISYLHKLCRSK